MEKSTERPDVEMGMEVEMVLREENNSKSIHKTPARGACPSLAESVAEIRDAVKRLCSTPRSIEALQMDWRSSEKHSHASRERWDAHLPSDLSHPT